jgi:hypothetical protein
VLATWEDIDGVVAVEVERRVMLLIRGEYELPQFLGRQEMGYLGGWTETFTEDGPPDSEIRERVEIVLKETVRAAAEG